MTKDYKIGDKIMKENTQEKNLVEKSESNIFGKIKSFFKKLFNKKEKKIDVETIQEETVEEKENIEFKESLKIVGIEEEELLELQRKFHEGEIVEGDLTDEQIDALCELYDKQIEEIEKNIEVVKQKIEDNKKRSNQKIQKNNA